ncbi:hypothetical protein GQ600_27124 [Phytophthora cactorum]|nr:hypothetical protein GQ600_27124 [Phytophthora cactorum]
MILKGCASVHILWRSPARQIELDRLVDARELLLKNTFRFFDGENLRIRTTVAWWMEVLTDEVDVHCVDSSVKNRCGSCSKSRNEETVYLLAILHGGKACCVLLHLSE